MKSKYNKPANKTNKRSKRNKTEIQNTSSQGEPFVVFGRHPVLEVLKGKLPVYKIQIQEDSSGSVISHILNNAEANRVEIEKVSRQELDSKFPGENHQGVTAFLSSYEYVPVEEILHCSRKADKLPFLVMLDHIQDPHNLGAVLRTASASGVDGVIIPRDRACEVTPSVFKASAGALAHVPVARVTNLPRELERLKKEGLWIMGGEMSGDMPFFEADLHLPLVLVLGSEGRGLSRLVKEKCDFLLHIPMEKSIASLNVAVAGGIIIYEVYRQRLH